MKNSTLREICKIGLIILVIAGLFASLCLYAYNKQKQRAVVEMADKILSASEHYAIMQIMDHNVRNVTINIAEGDELGLRGNVPKNGYVKILTDASIEIRFHYNGYCVTKSFEEFDNKFEKISEEKCFETVKE